MSAAPEVKFVPFGEEHLDVSVDGNNAGSLVPGRFYGTAEVIDLIATVAKLCGATVVKA